ncbi:MAG: tetratricopeptide repeat protein [bacterium]
MPRMFAPALVAMALFASVARTQEMPPRPSLAKGADRNDWEAYYDAGVEMLERHPTSADAAFLWAARLRPDRAEAPYARWIAFWATDVGRFEEYLHGEDKVLRDPLVLRADSLKARAFRHNPFLHPGLVVFLYDRLPGRFRDDEVTRGWISLGNGQLHVALDRFGHVIARDPKTYGYLRFVRASAFVNDKQYDSAAAELTTLLAQLRTEDEKVLGNGYESKEMLEYASGLLQLQSARMGPARLAFQRALTENPGFAPAHAWLGRIALDARDTATALSEYRQAVEIEPDDTGGLLGLGRALLAANHPREAVIQFQKVIALEPYFADGYYYLSAALETAGDKAGSATQLAAFVERATRNDPRRPPAP